MKPSYVIQFDHSSRCKECGAEVDLLCHENSPRQPWFYICWNCRTVAQLGRGMVRRDGEDMKPPVLQLERWQKALYSVTPGIGSECINDPEFCAERIRHTRTSQHEMIVKLTIENKSLKGEHT